MTISPARSQPDPVVQAMAAAVQTVGSTVIRLATTTARPGSRLQRSLTSVDVWSDVWAPRPQFEAYTLGCRLSHHAGDHLVGIAACLWAPGVLYSVPTLMRGAVESAARSAFLLDPTIEDRERVRRWLNERLYSLTEQARVLEGIEGRDAAAAVAERRHRIDDVLGAAARRGFTPSVEPGRRHGRRREPAPHVGERRPYAHEVIEMLEHQSGTGATMHRWKSGAVHGADHGLMMLTGVEPAADDPASAQVTVPLRVSAGELATWLAPVLTAAETTAQRLVAVHGYDRSEWDVVARPIFRQFKDWVSPPRAVG